MSIRAFDATGNRGAASTVSFVFDSTPPTPAPPVLANPGAIFSAAQGEITNATAPTLIVQGASQDVFTLYRDGLATSSRVGPGPLVDPTRPADGLHQYRVQETDVAGNSALSPALSVTIDTRLPAAPTGLHWLSKNRLSFQGVSGATSYEYALAPTGPFTTIGAATTFAPTGIAPGGTVFVRAIDAVGNLGRLASIVDPVATSSHPQNSGSSPPANAAHRPSTATARSTPESDSFRRLDRPRRSRLGRSFVGHGPGRYARYSYRLARIDSLPSDRLRGGGWFRGRSMGLQRAFGSLAPALVRRARVIEGGLVPPAVPGRDRPPIRNFPPLRQRLEHRSSGPRRPRNSRPCRSSRLNRLAPAPRPSSSLRQPRATIGQPAKGRRGTCRSQPSRNKAHFTFQRTQSLPARLPRRDFTGVELLSMISVVVSRSFPAEVPIMLLTSCSTPSTLN